MFNLEDEIEYEVARKEIRSMLYHNQCDLADTSKNGKVLEILAEEGNEDVQRNVARNKNTPAKVLYKLIKKRNIWIDIDISWNKNTPSQLLEELSYEKSWYIQRGVICNPNTSTDTLVYLLEKGDKDLRPVVLHQLQRRGIDV